MLAFRFSIGYELSIPMGLTRDFPTLLMLNLCFRRTAGYSAREHQAGMLRKWGQKQGRGFPQQFLIG
jgi:hypothetical protein